MNRSAEFKAADILLRVSVAFAFLYPPIDAWFNPYSWIGYFPTFIRGIVSDTLLLHTFGVVEILLALWILSGKKIVVPLGICVVMLVAIVFFDFRDIEVLFRDLSIAGMALALIFLRKSEA